MLAAFSIDEPSINAQFVQKQTLFSFNKDASKKKWNTSYCLLIIMGVIFTGVVLCKGMEA